MKLAAIYNVFDGEENLEESISSIKNNVEQIIVIYQEISNFGIKHKIDIEKYLKSIKEINLLIKYDTDLTRKPAENELIKRILGCKGALENKCTHFLHMDCDEFYDSKKFAACKQKIINNKYDSTACEINDYYKFNNLLVLENRSSYVPFISELNKGITKFGLNLNYPVLVDSTRKVNPNNNFHLFKKEEIVLEHKSWIRKNISDKLENSTARHSYEKIIECIVQEYNNFKIGDKLIKLETGLIVPKKMLNTVRIENYRDLETMEVK